MNSRWATMGAAAAAGAVQAQGVPIGKTEALIALALSGGFVKFAETSLPPEQVAYAWSLAGTVAGAVLAGMHMRAAGWLQRLSRAALCAVGGAILAPWAIGWLPKAGGIPEWWHSFAASGVASAIAWIVVDEAGPAIRDEIQAWRRRRKERK